MVATDSALDLAARLRRRELSSVELVRHSLDAIRRDNPALGAFVDLSERRALAEARRADVRLAAGDPAPFLGVPTGIKDHEHLRGHFTRIGSRAFRWVWSPFDGLTARACRRAGFVLVGKLACSELTILPFVDDPPARNPHHRDHYAGGSSAGSAAAVAANMIPIAAGTDGGGSIRIPASFCGLVGLKTTRGLLAAQHRGIDPVGISVLGPIARTARDAAAMLEVLGARGHRDACERRVPPLRARLLVRTSLIDVDPEIAAATHRIAAQLATLGHAVDEAPPISGEIDDFLPIMARMVSRIPVIPFLHGRLQPSTRWLHERGRSISQAVAIGAGDALARRVHDWFGDADVAITPTVAQPAPRVGAFANLDGEAVFRTAAPIGAFTAPFNVSGQPAITIPAGRTRSGLPIGVQLVGRHGADRTLLALAATLLGE